MLHAERSRARHRSRRSARLVVLLILFAVFSLQAFALSAEPAAESGRTAQTTAAAIEEYWILIRALGGGEDNRRDGGLTTARELLADRDLPAVLPELVRNATVEQKRLLARALGRTEDVRVVPFLIDLFSEDEVGYWVQSALAELGEPAAELLWAAMPVPPEVAAFPQAGARPTTVERWCQGAFYQMGARAVPFLVAKIKGGEAGERRKALNTLAWMHYSTFDLSEWPSEVVADLRRALDAPDSATRLGALRVLGEIEGRGALEPLARRMLADPDRTVALVAESLVRDGGPRPPCPDEAARVMAALAVNDFDRARDDLLTVMGVQRGLCDRDFAAALIPVLRDPRKGARELAIEGLSGTSSLAARRALGAALGVEPDRELRVKILGAGVADPATTLLPLLDSRDAAEQALMIEELGRQHVREAVPALVRRLQHDTLAMPAATALGAISDTAALPALMTAFEETAGTNWQGRGVLLASIGSIGGLQAMTFLGRALLVDDPTTRMFAADRLAGLVWPVGRIERVRTLVRPFVAEALKHPDASARAAVIGVVQASGDVERLDTLVRDDPDIEVRTKAREALSGLCEREAVRVLAAWLSDPDPRMRTEGVRAFSHHRLCDWDEAFTPVLWNGAGPPLLSLLASGDDELAASAGSALAWIHHPDGLDPIIEAFERRPALRLRLAYSLYNYGRDAGKAVPALMKVRPTAPPDLARAIDQILRLFEKR